MTIPEFKYFKDPEEHAVFTKTKCQTCDANENCLEGEYFDRGGNVVSVCFNCLINGLVTVSIPEYIISRIKTNNSGTEIMNNEYLLERANLLVDELSKTPPVPWIQYNDWPVCCNDFGRFVGEWDKSDIIQNAQNINTREYLLSILDNLSKEKIIDFDSFWDDIGNDTAIFVFECIHCLRITAVCQSY